MRLEYGDPGVYDVKVTIRFSAFLNDPDDDEKALREACIRLENGEVTPELEAELNGDDTNEYYAEKAAEHFVNK